MSMAKLDQYIERQPPEIKVKCQSCGDPIHPDNIAEASRPDCGHIACSECRKYCANCGEYLGCKGCLMRLPDYDVWVCSEECKREYNNKFWAGRNGYGSKDAPGRPF